MSTTNPNPTTQAFIRIVDVPQGQDGVAVMVAPDEKGAKVLIHVEGLLLQKTFHNKRPAKGMKEAVSAAGKLPPRTTSHCLINEYGFSESQSE